MLKCYHFVYHIPDVWKGGMSYLLLMKQNQWRWISFLVVNTRRGWEEGINYQYKKIWFCPLLTNFSFTAMNEFLDAHGVGVPPWSVPAIELICFLQLAGFFLHFLCTVLCSSNLKCFFFFKFFVSGLRVRKYWMDALLSDICMLLK